MDPNALTPGAAHVIHTGYRDQPIPFVVSSASSVHYRPEGFYQRSFSGKRTVAGLVPLDYVQAMIMVNARRGNVDGFEYMVAPARERALELAPYIDDDQRIQLDCDYTVDPPAGWRWELIAPRQLRTSDFWHYAITRYLASEPSDRLTPHQRARRQLDDMSAETFGAMLGDIEPLAARHGLTFGMQRFAAADGQGPDTWKIVIEPSDLLSLLRRIDGGDL